MLYCVMLRQLMKSSLKLDIEDAVFCINTKFIGANARINRTNDYVSRQQLI